MPDSTIDAAYAAKAISAAASALDGRAIGSPADLSQAIQDWR